MKRILASLVVVAGLFLGLVGPGAVRAQDIGLCPTIYLSDTGWSDRSAGTWDPVTRTATLTRDVIVQSIKILGDGITLEGNGHTIAVCPGGLGVGVLISGRTGVTVRNATVEGFWVGIGIENSVAVTVANCIASGNWAFGIYVVGSTGSVLSGNTVRSGRSDGLCLHQLSGGVVSGNTIEGNGGCGLDLYGSTNLDVAGNTMAGNRLDFGVNGDLVAHYEHNVAADNLVGGKRVYYIRNAVGQIYDGLADAGAFYCVNCDGVTVRNMALAHGADGVCLVNTHNSQVENIRIQEAGSGVRLVSSNNNTIRDCTMTGNMYGLWLQGAAGNEVYGNWLLSNSTQAYVKGGGGNLFSLPAPTGGNYWTGWTGPDADGDGFVDSPYVFTGGQDDLPLARLAPADTDAPITYWGRSDVGAPAQWTTSDVQGNLEAVDIGASGVKGSEYSFDGATWIAYSGSLAVRQEGTTTVYYRSMDNAGNVEETKSSIVKIDKTQPVVTRAVQGVAGNSGWYRSDVTILYTTSDVFSGLLDPADASFALTASGEGEGIMTNDGWPRVIYDRAGNEVAVGGDEYFSIDKTAPELAQGTVEGTAGKDGWYRSDVIVAFSAADFVSGLAHFADVEFCLTASGEGEVVSTGTREVSDVAGNVAVAGPLTFKIDKTAPVARPAVEGVAGNAGWYRSDVQVTLAAADAAGGSGVAGIEYSFDGATWTAYTGPFTVTQEGATTVYYRSIDNAGNVEEAKHIGIKIDKTAPVLTQGIVEGEAGKDGWYRSDVTVAYSAADSVSGLANAADPSFVLTASGEGEAVSTGTKEVSDVAGNVATAGPLTFKIDKTPPVVTSTITTQPNAAGWYNSNVTIIWTASDDLSGLDDFQSPLYVMIPGESDGDCDGAISQDSIVVRDLAGNEASAGVGDICRFKIDKTPPAITIATPEPYAVLPVGAALQFDAGDALSGVAGVTAALNNGTAQAPVTSGDTPAPGVYTLTVEATDQAGNRTAESRSFVVYDPNGGFVTGAGWFDSPAGAYAADPGLAGKVTFGFVARYQQGETVPMGQAEFQLKAGGLNLHSEGYEWLVIDGRAQCEGWGTINGSGAYGFLLSAADGEPDRLRLKIWDKATGALVYDNQLGAPDNAEPATVLGGGSIVVHAD